MQWHSSIDQLMDALQFPGSLLQLLAKEMQLSTLLLELLHLLPHFRRASLPQKTVLLLKGTAPPLQVFQGALEAGVLLQQPAVTAPKQPVLLIL